MTVKALNELSASEAAREIAAGRLSSEALVSACLKRIQEREDTVGAWIHLNPEQALAEARLRDQHPGTGPLHGVPVGIKDIIDTADQPTAYGSPIYDGNHPAWDAASVALLRRAGAVILGKTVTTEFACRTAGKATNPHNPAHTPGGSSSGSAAAVAAEMVPLALGHPNQRLRDPSGVLLRRVGLQGQLRRPSTSRGQTAGAVAGHLRGFRP